MLLKKHFEAADFSFEMRKLNIRLGALIGHSDRADIQIRAFRQLLDQAAVRWRQSQ